MTKLNGFVTHAVEPSVNALTIDQVKDFLEAIENDNKVAVVTSALSLKPSFSDSEKLDLKIEVATFSKPRRGAGGCRWRRRARAPGRVREAHHESSKAARSRSARPKALRSPATCCSACSASSTRSARDVPVQAAQGQGAEALASKYDVTVRDVERGWLPGDFSLINVKLATRPNKLGEVPKIIKIDRLNVEVGVLSTLIGGVDIGIDPRSARARPAVRSRSSQGLLVKIDLASRNLRWPTCRAWTR